MAGIFSSGLSFSAVTFHCCGVCSFGHKYTDRARLFAASSLPWRSIMCPRFAGIGTRRTRLFSARSRFCFPSTSCNCTSRLTCRLSKPVAININMIARCIGRDCFLGVSPRLLSFARNPADIEEICRCIIL